MKNPENYPMKGFAQVKKITTHIFQKGGTWDNLKIKKFLISIKKPALCRDCEASILKNQVILKPQLRQNRKLYRSSKNI